VFLVAEWDGWAPASIIHELGQHVKYVIAKEVRLPDHGVMMDIGCRYGAAATVITHLYPESRVLSYEPVPYHRFLCELNFVLNRAIRENIDLQPAATTEKMPVNKILAAIQAHKKIGFVKFDCHGCEFPAALMLSNDTLSRLPLVVGKNYPEFTARGKGYHGAVRVMCQQGWKMVGLTC